MVCFVQIFTAQKIESELVETRELSILLWFSLSAWLCDSDTVIVSKWLYFLLAYNLKIEKTRHLSLNLAIGGRSR